jgi:hypothetical protein
LRQLLEGDAAPFTAGGYPRRSNEFNGFGERGRFRFSRLRFFSTAFCVPQMHAAIGESPRRLIALARETNE